MGTQILLTINSGSSSCKADVFTISGTHELSEKIATVSFHQTHHVSEPADTLFEWVDSISQSYEIAAIGHRFVHGGDKFDSPQLIMDSTLADLEYLTVFDNLHNSPANELIAETMRRYPNVPQVVCFDTSFYKAMPEQARLIALPDHIQKLGVRRYGFHGLSYEYVQQEFERQAGTTAMNGRVIYAHLGSGSSLTATKDRVPIDTTMGFSPASGIPTGTRSGDIDPTLAAFLEKNAGLSSHKLASLAQEESGLKAISGSSGDMKSLLEREEHDPKAAQAVDFYVYHVKKAIGALGATINGIDSLVFTGGIGEQSSVLRKRICETLGFLGLILDDKRNDKHEFTISADGSATGVHVIPTNEAAVIARQTMRIIQQERRA
ncbi:MAG TPA: acetate/propionate family kinase [Candidatus Saccharibacteria bacterium]|nr:acetate/propionate family kinase [Candidatus Saccharibacteria bacterium]HRK93921.1 acetate/propionate family kinase [Candidatus Saccharibacteria bacterium]